MKQLDKTSRSKNLILNVFTGFLSQFLALLLSLISRRIFVSFLPLEYLGINGLYTNILTVLSLTEMGLDSAFVFLLYKPISEDNYQLISALLAYFKKIYLRITAILVGIGLCLVPVLKYIVNIQDGLIISEKELILYYLVFLLNTVIPYFFARYSILLSASQQNRIKHILTIVTNIIMQIMYIVVLYLFKSYKAYIATTVIMTGLHWFLLRIITRSRYDDYFREYEPVQFDTSIIKQKVKSTILYKYGAVAINHTDNILISILVSTTAVGYYYNYYTITAALQGLISIISSSLLSGLGNLFATAGNDDSKENLFYSQLFIYHLIGSIGFIGIYILIDKFIAIWLGYNYILGKDISFCIALCFYITNATGPIWINREANGLFERVKYLMIIRAIINLTLSIILGKMYGTFGILLATSLSILMTSFWVEPRILFKKVFQTTTINYWKTQIIYFIITLVVFSIVLFVDSRLESSLFTFVIEIMMIVMLCMISFSLYFRRKKEGIFLINRIKDIIIRKRI